MNIASATFQCSAPSLASCPDESLPEFAFIGRSNVGKSSLLNMLVGQNGLARVSPTPGFTKLINFFLINQTWRLVDLPGYGFAQVAREESARFNKSVNDYLRHRPNLACVFVLIDSGLPPQKIDLEFLEWMTSHSLPYVIVFTKTDRSSAEHVAKNMAAFTGEISKWFQQLPQVLTCSSVTGQGRSQLLAVIEEAIAAGEVQEVEATEQPSEPEIMPEPDEEPRGFPVRAGRDKSERRPLNKRKIHRPW